MCFHTRIKFVGLQSIPLPIALDPPLPVLWTSLSRIVHFLHRRMTLKYGLWLSHRSIFFIRKKTTSPTFPVFNLSVIIKTQQKIDASKKWYICKERERDKEEGGLKSYVQCDSKVGAHNLYYCQNRFCSMSTSVRSFPGCQPAGE